MNPNRPRLPAAKSVGSDIASAFMSELRALTQKEPFVSEPALVTVGCIQYGIALAISRGSSLDDLRNVFEQSLDLLSSQSSQNGVDS